MRIFRMYNTVVVARLNRWKRSKAVFGSKDNQHYCDNTILDVSLRPHTTGIFGRS